jgi:hypothetical protein
MDTNNVSRPLVLGILGVLFILIAVGIAYYASAPEFTYDYPNRSIQKNVNQEIVLPKTTGKVEDVEKALQAETANEDALWNEEDKIAEDIIKDDADVSSLEQNYENQI